jgi:hypothetical protein
MEGARAPKFRPYWIRYLVAFNAGEKLKWARDNVLIACLCSLAPGLIAAGIGASLSDDKWRAAAHATLLTYGGLIALFLIWRLVATPLELDRENRRFINGLNNRLALARLRVASLQARPPALEVEIQEIHVQAAEAELPPHVSGIAGNCDIFLRAKLTLTGTLPIKVLAYELSRVWHGNTVHAYLVDDIQDWGLVTQKKPVGVGTTFHYTVTRLMQLARKVEQRGVPMEGWLHFCVKAIHEQETEATIYRLTILTRNGAISRDSAGASLADWESRHFQKVLYHPMPSFSRDQRNSEKVMQALEAEMTRLEKLKLR